MSSHRAKCELHDFICRELFAGREDAIPASAQLVALIEAYVLAAIEEATGGAP